MVNSLHKLPVMQKAFNHDVITWPNAYIRSSTMGMGSSISNVCGSTTTGFHRCHLKVSLVPEPQGNAAIMERVITVRWKYRTRCQAGNCMVHCHVSRLAETHFEGILPKGPYLPCVSKAGRALLAGYHRFEDQVTRFSRSIIPWWQKSFWHTCI